jgi:hypothetical protein
LKERKKTHLKHKTLKGQNNPIDVNFHPQKVWKVSIKDQLTKSDQK